MIDKIKKHAFLRFLLIIAASVFASLFLFKKGIFYGHDLEYHLSRIESIAECIKIGDLKAVIHEGYNGYGYPNGLCYSNIFLYLPALMLLLGVNAIVTYKIYILLITFATGLVMYYCTYKITKSEFAATVSAVVYVTSSYRICDVMVRAALGEVMAFLFVPVIILGLYYIIYDDYKKYYVFTLGFVGLLLSHLITTFIMVFVSIVFIVINYEKLFDERKRILYFIYSAVWGVLLSAFFLFPFLEFYLKTDINVKYRNNPVITMDFFQSLSGIPKFTTVFVAPGIGLLFAYFIYNYIYVEVKEKKFFSFEGMSNIIGVLILVMIAVMPWAELGKVVAFIELTWRFFVPVLALFSISGGYYFEKYIGFRKYSGLIAVAIPAVAILLTLVYQVCSVKHQLTYYDFETPYYMTKADSYPMTMDEYYSSSMDIELLYEDEREPKCNNPDIVFDFEDKGSILYLEYNNNDRPDSYIDIPQLYYIGFKAIDVYDKKTFAISDGYNKWIRVWLGTCDSANIKIYYRGTNILVFSYLLSLCSWIGFIIYRSVISRKKDNKE